MSVERICRRDGKTVPCGAIEALIKKANMEVLSAHMKSCVKNAQTEEEKDQKIEEMVQVLTRMSR